MIFQTKQAGPWSFYKTVKQISHGFQKFKAWSVFHFVFRAKRLIHFSNIANTCYTLHNFKKGV